MNRCTAHDLWREAAGWRGASGGPERGYLETYELLPRAPSLGWALPGWATCLVALAQAYAPRLDAALAVARPPSSCRPSLCGSGIRSLLPGVPHVVAKCGW